jgi:signal transduction histidine kinase
MIGRPGHARAWLRRPDRTVSRSIVALVATALIAFTVVATGTSIVAGRIARDDALAEALRSAVSMGNTVFEPLLPAAMRGSSDAIGRLDAAVSHRSIDGSLVRVKVWKRDGTVIYSDDHKAIGAQFPLHADVARTIDEQKYSAALSDLQDPENATENGLFRRLVEVYIPLTLDDGTQLAFEMYSTDARVQAAERALRSQLVPFTGLALLILVIAQLPVSVWLVRRIGRAQDDHRRLLNNALFASGRERRAIARDLHDGVVQDLAGAGYAIGALARTLPTDTDARSRHIVDTVGGVLGKSVGSLRSLLVDIYPPDLTADGLQAAIEDLAGKLRERADIDVEVTVELQTEPSPEVAAMLYRCARECLANIANYAKASQATLQLTGDAKTVRFLLRDNGIGIPATGIDRRAEGHFGLPLLCDAAKDLGGEMQVFSPSSGGTTVALELPTAGIGLVGQAT